MHPFDLEKAQLAVHQSRVADWQLNQALQIFRTRQNPKASILGILVELNYIDKNLALELNRHPSQNLQNSYSNFAEPPLQNSLGTSASSAPNLFNQAPSNPAQDNSPTISMNSRDFMSALKASDSGSTSDSSSPFMDASPPRGPATAIHHSQSPSPYQSTSPMHSQSPHGSGAPQMSQAVQNSNAPNQAPSFLNSSDVQTNASVELTGRETFGRYELRGTVARGGMGTVYRAYLAELDKTFALKTLGANRDEVDLQRFLHEARAAAKLRHPNIVPVHDIGIQDGKHFFTMDLISGNSLDEIVHKDGNFEARDAALLCAKLFRALQYAHSNGVIHRDIKPGNILIETSTNEPYITDFGLARSVESSVQLTKTGFAVGTPNYMAPEQASGQKDVDGRADVYGIGTLLYSIICGRPPYDGPNALATMTSVINDPIPSLKVLNPNIPNQLDEICQRAMAKEREDRFESPLELAEALDACFSESSGRFIAANKNKSQIYALVLVIFLLLGIASTLGVVRYRSHAAFSDFLQKSQAARVAGDLDNASAFLEEARKIRPDSETLAAEMLVLNMKIEDQKKVEKEKKELAQQEALKKQEVKRLKKALAQATEAFQRRDYISSLQLIDSLILKSPKNAKLLKLQAQNNYALLRFPQAEKALETLSSISTDQDPEQKREITLLHAYIAFEQSNFKRAQNLIDELNTQPEFPQEALILSAFLKYEDEKPEQSRRLFARIGEEQRKNPWYRGLAILLTRENFKWEEVLKESTAFLKSEDLMPSLRARILIVCAESRHWLRLTNQFPLSTQNLREALPLSHKSIRSLRSIQEVALWTRDYDFSNQVLKIASKIKRHPGTLSFMRARPNFYKLRDMVNRRTTNQFRNLARAVLNQYVQASKQGEKSADLQRELGRTYFYIQQYPSAIKCFRLAHEINSLDRRNIRGLIDSQYQARQYKNALSSSEIAIKLNPKDPSLLVLLYNSYAQLKDYKNAIKTAQRYIKLVPNTYQGLYMLSASQANAGQRAQAQQSAKSALKFTTNDLNGWCQAYFICAKANLGNDLVERYFLKILNNPVTQQNLQIYLNFLNNLSRQGSHKLELRLADKIFKSTNQTKILLVRARSYFTLGDTQKAQADLLRAKQNPNFQNVNLIHWLLGCTQLVGKDVKSAYDSWSRINNPETEMMFMALRLLCRRKLGLEDTRERSLIQGFIPKLKGFQQSLIPLLRYLLGSFTWEQFQQKTRGATNAELLTRQYVVLGVKAMFNGKTDEAKDYFLKASKQPVAGQLSSFARQLLKSVN